MRFLLLNFALAAILFSCSDSGDSKQLRAEDSVRTFEQELLKDTSLIPVKNYSRLEKKELKFDLSPEGNSFAELDSLGIVVLQHSWMLDSIQLLMEDAARKHDDKQAQYFISQMDSLRRIQLSLGTKEEELVMGRDSVARVLGKREFYHLTAHDAAGKVVREYMMDTVTFQVKYWRFGGNEIYRKK